MSSSRQSRQGSLRRALSLVVVGAAVVSSVATSQEVQPLPPPFPPDTTQASDSTLEEFLVTSDGIFISSRADFTSSQVTEGRLVIDLFLNFDDIERVSFRVLHGGDPATAVDIEAPLGELQVTTPVPFRCTEGVVPCEHQEPILVELNRIDDGVEPVEAGLMVTAILDVPPNGEDAVDVTMVQPSAGE